MKDFFIGVLIPGLLVLGVVFLLGQWYRSAQCYARWGETRVVEWSILTKCMVEVDGVLVPEDRVWFERNTTGG